MFVHQPAVLSAWWVLPSLQLLPEFLATYRQEHVNLICVHCQCFGNGPPSVRVSREELAVDCFHPLAAYLSGWGGAERCRRSWRSLAVQRVGPVLPHGVIAVGVDLCVGSVLGGLLLQEQALYKCLRTANCSNQFK